MFLQSTYYYSVQLITIESKLVPTALIKMKKFLFDPKHLPHCIEIMEIKHNLYENAVVAVTDDEFFSHEN